MKKIDPFRQSGKTVVLAFIPPACTAIVQGIWGTNVSFWINSLQIAVAAVLSFVLILIIQKIWRRKYKKHEGKWIQVIPGFERKISICTLSFKNDMYHFGGENYRDSVPPVAFQSKHVVEDENNAFYYITKGKTRPPYEGFGEIYSISNESGYYTAKGYFLDIQGKDQEKIYDTFMIKFDEKFWSKCPSELGLTHGDDPNDFTDQAVYNCAKNYINQHPEIMNSSWIRSNQAS